MRLTATGTGGGLKEPTMEPASEPEPEEVNEITKFNYEEGIQELLAKIKTADFVAVDATVETTGYVMKNEEFNQVYMKDVEDCFGTWYDKIKDNESTHCLLEVGVAVFKRCPDDPNVFTAEVYNIPILPACVDENDVGRFRGHFGVRIKIDGYGQEFMTSVGFDINKPFYVAAPYLNRNLCKIADDYIRENPTFMVSSSSRRKCPNKHLMPDVYEFVGDEERKTITERLRGVSKVFEELATVGVPIVGHNMLLKMMFIFKDFIEYLPDTYPEYFDKMSSMFKLIYDTKQMAVDLREIPSVSANFSPRLSEHKLYSLLRNINQEPAIESFKVVVSDRVTSYMEDAYDLCLGEEVERDNKSYCYVAGFDAFVSGLVFLDLICILKLSKFSCSSETESEAGKSIEDTEIADDASGRNSGDHYEMLIKGQLAKLKNRLYGEPAVPAPSERGKPFQRWTEEKKNMRQRIEEERRRAVRATFVDGIRTLSGAK